MEWTQQLKPFYYLGIYGDNYRDPFLDSCVVSTFVVMIRRIIVRIARSVITTKEWTMNLHYCRV